jgi:hypothetical protein
MQRRNHRRVSAAMQYAVRAWLNQTAFGRGVFLPEKHPLLGWRLVQKCGGARPAQIRAAAKQIVKAGKLPSGMHAQLRRSV